MTFYHVEETVSKLSRLYDIEQRGALILLPENHAIGLRGWAMLDFLRCMGYYIINPTRKHINAVKRHTLELKGE